MSGHSKLLESMSHMDDFIDHTDGTCGHCMTQIIWATVAREMLAVADFDIKKWETESRRRWQETKFFKLWQAEKAAGRDPRDAFTARGWEP